LSPSSFNAVNSGTRSTDDYFYIVKDFKISPTSVSIFNKSKADSIPVSAIEPPKSPKSYSAPIIPVVVIQPTQSSQKRPTQPEEKDKHNDKPQTKRRRKVHLQDDDEDVKPQRKERTRKKTPSPQHPTQLVTIITKAPVEPFINVITHPIRSRANESDAAHISKSIIGKDRDDDVANSNPISIFGSTKTILQQFTQIPSDISKINMFDQNIPSFLNKRWLEGLNDPQLNTRWNPIASIYSVLLYVQQVLQWPLMESRVVVNYGKPAFRLSAIAEKIYKHCNIEDKLAESDPIIKLLVWCILSMKTYGIIRPIIFKASTENGGRLTEFCAYRHRRDCILVYATWPFRVDSDKLYWIVDQTKLKEMSLKSTILSDQHIDKKPKKVLKSIPNWVYTLCSSLLKDQ
jgi:hypothetical protein